MISGKPAFEVPDADKAARADEFGAPAPVQPPTAPVVITGGGRIDHGRRVDEQGRKIIPEVQIVRLQPHLSGEHLEASAFVRNNSAIEVELDKVNIFSQTLRLDRWLKPGEEHETVVYRGPRLRSSGYTLAEIYYKDCDSGDYFCARHQLDYRQEADGSFLPHSCHLLHPIKDV
ncbi:MAG TPA: hypothetical protein VFL81_03295 [Candidatus Saccharimonadales bacterium]|nr:hypothetical protein [Candidatus Saccharimonadales bacterium]